jgi:hypothetical protein
LVNSARLNSSWDAVPGAISLSGCRQQQN